MEKQDKRQALISAFADYAMEHRDRILKDSIEVTTVTHEDMNGCYISEVSLSMNIADMEYDNWKYKSEWESLFLDMVAEFYKRLNKRNKDGH